MNDGKMLFYLGKPYHLILEKGEKRIYFEEGTLNFCYPTLRPDILKKVYLDWLKEEAEK